MAAKRAKHRARTLPVDAKPGMVELTASKRTFIECTCACSSKDPHGCKDIRVCPPSPRQTGRSCSFKSRLGASTKSLTTINGTSQSMSTSRNDRPPTRKGNHPVMGGPYRACQRQEAPQSAQMYSWDFLVLWMLIRAGHAERHPASALPVSAAVGPLRSPSASAEWG